MSGVYSWKKLIVLIQRRNEHGLFREEMNSAYLGKNEYCLFREEMNNVYSGKK
jgi:hypothetical protein